MGVNEALPRGQAVSEADAGGLAWLMGAMDFPDYAPEIYAYGTVIGTGNVVATWRPPAAPTAQAGVNP